MKLVTVRAGPFENLRSAGQIALSTVERLTDSGDVSAKLQGSCRLDTPPNFGGAHAQHLVFVFKQLSSVTCFASISPLSIASNNVIAAAGRLHKGSIARDLATGVKST